MRTFLDLFLHPERRRPGPQPRQVDLRRAILAGITLWAVAAAVLAVVGLTTDLSVRSNLVVCATGGGLGLLALAWEKNNRRRYRAVADTVDVVRTSATSEAPAPAEDPVEADGR